jgi:hypothetical protein
VVETAGVEIAPSAGDYELERPAVCWGKNGGSGGGSIEGRDGNSFGNRYFKARGGVAGVNLYFCGFGGCPVDGGAY